MPVGIYVTVTKMKTHKRIIGICWIVFGALILALLAQHVDDGKGQTLLTGALIGLAYLVAGFTLLANLPRSSWICLPCSALSLFSFPVGTVVGVYYLWYYFTLERVR